jgi:hypothetical protein
MIGTSHESITEPTSSQVKSILSLKNLASKNYAAKQVWQKNMKE